MESLSTHTLIRETDHPFYAIYETHDPNGTLHISLLLYDGYLFPYVSDLFHLFRELEHIKKWNNNLY